MENAENYHTDLALMERVKDTAIHHLLSVLFTALYSK